MMRNSWTMGLGNRRCATLLGVLLTIACVTSWAPLVRAQAATPSYPEIEWLKWNVKVGSAVQAESTYLQLNGAPATNHTLDTTAVFDARTKIMYQAANSAVNATANGTVRMFIESVSGAVATTDTLFYAIIGSPDKVNWVVLKAATAVLFATANDRLVSTPLLMDTDAAYDPYLFPYWRFVARSDASGSSTFPNARFGLCYFKRPGS